MHLKSRKAGVPGYGTAVHRLIAGAMRDDKRLAAPIRDYLWDKGITVEQFAELCGVWSRGRSETS